MSYDRLDPINPTDAQAQALLARAAHFAPGQPIPRDLLLATITRAAQDSDDALQAEDALRRLLDFGLLEPEALDAFRLHRLLAAFVQMVARDTAAQTAVEDVLLAAVERLLDAGYSGPLLTLHPHLRALTESMQPREEARTAHLETALGESLYVVGDYAGAQPAYEHALAITERVLGPEHPNVAVSLGNLATLHQAQGRYEAAEPLHQRALAINEQALGSQHPHVATGLNNLALLYYTQGRYAEAEPLLRRVLILRERGLGPAHPHVGASLHSLALLYYTQGRYAEAEPLYQQALAINERALGPEHPDTAIVRKNYAVLQHRRREAAPSPSLWQWFRAWLSRI